MNQTTIFDMMYPKYKITKPIRLIEFFGGYGSQALALKYLGIEFEHWKLVEWAVKSIQAYKDIHFPNRKNDYSQYYNKEEIVDILFNLGISSNYNEPMTLEQIKRLNEMQLRNIYNNIMITHNLVNIQQVKGDDLAIVDTDKYDYILTYSFPCQDLSLAGKGKGMSDTSTRSGMLWEVERILTECHELGTMPQILLMENVPQVHGANNVEDFNKWQLRLEELGYKNYWQDLIATDYGIPQTRNRCFMISILGDYSYTFPKPIPLKLKLKDMLENNVDEKYYLSGKTIKTMLKYNKDYVPCGLSPTLTTELAHSTGKNLSPKLTKEIEYAETLEKNNIDDTCYIDAYNRSINKDNSGTITTGVSFRNNTVVAVKEKKDDNLLKRELCNQLIQEGLVEEGDVVKHSYTQQILDGNKKCVEKNDGNMITLTTRGDCVGVCVGTYQYSKSDKFMQGKDRLQLGKDVSDTLQTTQKEGVVINNINSKARHQQDIIQDSNGNARTLVCGTHGNGGHYTKTLMNDLRIRKLTPRECMRLMGVKDEDYEKCAKNQSNASLYHLAGDSLITTIMMALFSQMLDINWEEHFNSKEWWNNEQSI